MFAEPKFLGRNYIMNPVTMYVENEATKISWYMYETRGGCIANISAIACADFNMKGISDDGQEIQINFSND